MSNKRFHCTGPIEIVVRVAKPFGPGPVIFPDSLSGATLDLGTCEQHPINQGEALWEDVPNDLGGTMIGLDKQFQGSTEIIILDLNRFDYSVMAILENIPTVGRAPSDAPGFTDGLARGSYKQQNGFSFEMWLYYTFFGTRVAAAYPLMPPGIYYPCCSLMQDNIPKQGTKTQTKRLVVEADWAFFEGSAINPALNEFFLKTSDPAYF